MSAPEVDSPAHYQFGQMEAWDIIEIAIDGIADPVTAYHTASALKYLLRAARKNGNQDIAKARAHLKREVARHVVSAPQYDPDDVAFRRGELARPGEIRIVPDDTVPARTFRIGGHPPRTAAEIAAADGVSEYGNPVAPWRLP